MSVDDSTADPAYEPPTILRLGSLAELTLGGSVGLSDGVGTAGDGGSA